MPISNYDKCRLLLPFNEAVGATNFLDYSTLPLEGFNTISGVSISDTPGYKAGVWGAGSYLSFLAGDRRFYFGSSDWTIRFKHRRSGTNQDFARIFQTRDGDVIAGIGIYFGSGADANKLYLTCSLNGSSTAFTSSVINAETIDVEYDYEFIRSGTTIKGFLNGTEVYSTTLSGALFYSASDRVVIGGQSTPARSIIGYLRDFEVYIGAALHTSGFTAPSGGTRVKTFSGNVKDDTNTNAARLVRAYPRGVPTRGFETTSDGTSGNYSILVPDVDGGYIVAALDDASGTTYKDLVHSQVVPV